MVEDFNKIDGDDSTAKDTTEIELEKLVFGDTPGFHEGLKSYRDASIDLARSVNSDRQQAQDGLEEGDLEGFDDADVCKVQVRVGLAFAQHPSSSSFSTPHRPS